MFPRSIIFFVMLVAFAAEIDAQISHGGDAGQSGNVRVRVIYSDQRSAGMHLRVRLMNGSGDETVADYFTTDIGTVEFNGVPLGDYHIVVSGEGIEQTDSGQFEVDRRKMSQSIFITVRYAKESTANGVMTGSSVDKSDLSIPEEARKEFVKGAKAIADRDWTAAERRLTHATEIYPQYALAYNNLGLVYAEMKDTARERQALEKALELNDHLVSAMVNLAKLSLREGDPVKAESSLENATRADPNNAEPLALLAQSQLLNKKYEAAIASAHSAHCLPHSNLAVVHYIAARALEHENRRQEAIAELRVFLKEESSGPRADQVRKEVTQLEKEQQ